jgi:hypothetical protein
MRRGWLAVAGCALGVCCAGLWAQQGNGSGAHVCECGAHPPGPPKDRIVAPYAGEPADLSPYAKFAAPYDVNYVHPNIYAGAGRDVPEPKNLSEVRIGFFGPVAPNPESIFGTRMLHGAQLAVEEANARGGYGGKPFKLMEHKRSSEDGVRRPGLGHLRFDQFRVDPHCPARGLARGDSDRQFGID